jgi:ferritin
MGDSIMADTTKFKSVGIDIDSYKKLMKICEHQRRNVRQQLGLMIDLEYQKEDYKKDNVTSLGLGAINSLHTRD